MLLDPSTFSKVASTINAADLSRPDHRLIFEAIAELGGGDVVTVSDLLERRGKLEDAGGLAYLATLAGDTPTAEHILAYVQIVLERSRRRLLQAISAEVSDQIRAGTSAAEIAARMLSSVDAVVGERVETLRIRHVADIVAEQREPEWLEEDILERGVIAIVAGARGTFKSFVAMHWPDERRCQRRIDH